MITKKNNYNNVPVSYCKTCLSLAITNISIKHSERHGDDLEIGRCVDCGNTDIEEVHIEDWEIKYEERCGKKFLDERSK